MIRRTYAVIAALALAGVAQAAPGQSSLYTKNTLGNLRMANSASGYSGSRIRSNVVRSSVPRYNYSNAGKNVFGNVFNNPQKPFSGASRAPSVTPYLGLDSPFTSSASNYYSVVRPQLEQQRVNEQMAQRNAALQHQLNSLTAQPPYNPQGDQNMMPTGHTAVYLNYGSFYPQIQGQQKR